MATENSKPPHPQGSQNPILSPHEVQNLCPRTIQFPYPLVILSPQPSPAWSLQFRTKVLQESKSARLSGYVRGGRRQSIWDMTWEDREAFQLGVTLRSCLCLETSRLPYPLYWFPRTCCNKRSQTGWLKRKDIYSLTILEARSLKSRSPQGHDPSEGSREESFLAPSRFWG